MCFVDNRQSSGVEVRRKKAKNPGLYVKTVMCKFFLEKACTRGNKCLFAHSQNELRDAPDFSHTRLCPDLANCKRKNCSFAHDEAELREPVSIDIQACTRGNKCLFAHSQSELRDAPDFSHTRLCPDFANCKRKNCSFAHDEAELREPVTVDIQGTSERCETRSIGRFDCWGLPAVREPRLHTIVKHGRRAPQEKKRDAQPLSRFVPGRQRENDSYVDIKGDSMLHEVQRLRQLACHIEEAWAIAGQRRQHEIQADFMEDHEPSHMDATSVTKQLEWHFEDDSKSPNAQLPCMASDAGVFGASGTSLNTLTGHSGSEGVEMDVQNVGNDRGTTTDSGVQACGVVVKHTFLHFFPVAEGALLRRVKSAPSL